MISTVVTSARAVPMQKPTAAQQSRLLRPLINACVLTGGFFTFVTLFACSSLGSLFSQRDFRPSNRGLRLVRCPIYRLPSHIHQKSPATNSGKVTRLH